MSSPSWPTTSRTRSSPTDADIASHFDARKETYRVPEQRRSSSCESIAAELAATIKIPREDVERNYNARLGTYTDARSRFARATFC